MAAAAPDLSRPASGFGVARAPMGGARAEAGAADGGEWDGDEMGAPSGAGGVDVPAFGPAAAHAAVRADAGLFAGVSGAAASPGAAAGRGGGGRRWRRAMALGRGAAPAEGGERPVAESAGAADSVPVVRTVKSVVDGTGAVGRSIAPADAPAVGTVDGVEAWEAAVPVQRAARVDAEAGAAGGGGGAFGRGGRAGLRGQTLSASVSGGRDASGPGWGGGGFGAPGARASASALGGAGFGGFGAGGELGVGGGRGRRDAGDTSGGWGAVAASGAGSGFGEDSGWTGAGDLSAGSETAGPGGSGGQGGGGGTSVVLDGRLVGYWLGERMARDAARPEAGPTFFDARQGPAWTPSGVA